MASASLHEKRGIWQAVWYDPDRKPPRIWRTLRTKDAGTARARLVQLEREHGRGDYDPWNDRRSFERLSIPDAARRYIETGDFADGTQRQKESLLNRLDAHVGGLSVSAIQPRDLESFLEGHTAVTHNNMRGALRAFFSWLVDEGYLRKSPADGLKTRKQNQSFREALRPADIDRIIGVGSALGGVRPYFPAVITLLASTGLRVGEFASLEVGDCRGDRIHVGRSFQTKTRKGRMVPLFPRAQAALRSLIEDRDHGHVSPVGTSALWKAFNDWSGHAFPGRGLTIHHLRHTFISWMVNDLALPLPVAMRIAGHTRVTTTMKYVHVTPDMVMDAIERLHDTATDRGPSDVAVWLSTHGLQDVQRRVT